eukprot:TRINITY_DN61461_c0_g1_i1.p1 TRINITY_DN61461_c0_g1~~TRINITY_DN61461_c0_g1_i1.p1  ORF type:complete len:385 (+),score=59.56 TRINITY_DN61461_c0_g1_i1:61-1215(+)
MLYIEQEFVDPLFRAPLTLSIAAACLKYLATAWVLDDPALKTKKALKQERETEASSDWVFIVRLTLRLVFLILSAQVFFEDAGKLYRGMPLVSSTIQWIHGYAMVLAFSPNTIAFAPAACIFEAFWLLKISDCRSRWHRASDILAAVYGCFLATFYGAPLIMVATTYGLCGATVISFAFFYDALTLPWRLVSGHMSAIWVAVPVFVALGVLFFMFHTMLFSYYLCMSYRYPELYAQIKASGLETKKMFQAQMPHKVAGNIIGRAREIGLSKLGFAGDDRSEDLRHSLEPHAEGAFEVESAEDPAQEKCLLNDQASVALCASKIFTCLSLPLLQLCVVVAARMCLGESAWTSALHSFEERSWSHYLDHVSEVGSKRLSSLVWIYL